MEDDEIRTYKGTNMVLNGSHSVQTCGIPMEWNHYTRPYRSREYSPCEMSNTDWSRGDLVLRHPELTSDFTILFERDWVDTQYLIGEISDGMDVLNAIEEYRGGFQEIIISDCGQIPQI